MEKVIVLEILQIWLLSKFYRIFSDSLILQTLSAKLNWSYCIEFLKMDDILNDLEILNQDNKMSTDLFFRNPYLPKTLKYS
jgi:hypothetical protein